METAQEDLSKMLEKHRSPKEKIVWLQHLKSSNGVRRGGRHRSYRPGNEYAESSAGVAEKMEISLRDCGEQEEVPFLEGDDGNEEAEDIPYYPISVCTDVKVDKEEEVPAFGIPSCTSGSVDCGESEGVEDTERNRMGGEGVYHAISFRALSSDVAAGQGNSSLENCFSERDVGLPLRSEVDREGEEVHINIGSCTSGGSSKNRVEVGASKKSKRKHMVSRFALASVGKPSRRKGVVGKGRLDEVPATPQKRDSSPVSRTPEKLERSDEKIVRWVNDKVGAECFGKKNAASTWDCRKHRGFVNNAPKAIGLNDVVVLTLTQSNEALIVAESWLC